jgi:glutaminyl-peptide cyclotransferase
LPKNTIAAMQLFKFLTLIILTTFIGSCGSNSEQKKSDFSISSNAKKNTISNSDTLTLTINNPKNHSIDSVSYSINGQRVLDNIDLNGYKLGKQTIKATIYFNSQSQYTSLNLVILNSKSPKIYNFKIINEYPHDITSYTQGLEFYNGVLYESTGQRGKSKLRKVDYKTGKILKNIDLDKVYFGEGLTILNNNLYQLTWQSGTGFVYNPDTLEKKSSFKYGNSKEGWGLCNDGKVIYKSDGTEKIWTLNPKTLTEKNYIQAYTNHGKISNMNELEWINGKIYANRYQKNGVAIINPKNGAIEGVIDFSSLKNKVTQHPTLDVLNGIAYNPDTKTIFVTGKHWDKLFEVEILEK